MLKISDYEFLIALHRSRNITQAAQSLFVSQPALTKRLQQIEQDLDTVIVNRNVKGVQFTAEGEYVVQYAYKCIEDYKELKRGLSGLHEQQETTISIASAGTLAHELLPALFQAFRNAYPHIHLRLQAVGSGESAQRVHNGQADLAFVCGEQPWNFQRITIRSEYMTLLYHKPVELSELPFLSRIDPMFSVNSSRLVANWWQNNFDIPPRISMNVPNLQTCVAFVARGLGYSILMDQSVYQDKPQLFRYFLRDNQGAPVERRDYLIYLPDAEKKEPVREFIQFCRTYFATSVGNTELSL